MFKPVKSVKNHIHRNRAKYVAVPAIAGGIYVGAKGTLWTQFLTNPEAFELMYPAKS